MNRTSALAALRAAGVVAVLRAPSADRAVRAVDALVAGGITGIEITYSTPDAADAIREIDRRYGAGVQLGAGTVRTASQAKEAVAAGARFLVSPGTDPSLAEAMLDTGAAAFFGALTPSEVITAVRLGAHAVKVFPASLGGPGYLASLRGPFPDVPFMPTGGVRADNIGHWLRSGAVAVGAGSELCSASAMAAGRWDEIEYAARQFADAFTQAITEGRR
ncbi:bifunctional 4-hydroxy-2-oxoglutarate aldolase/2-dehydro-3-deoxy-phosphogluconate aldolase [Streptomyces inhibens]|uniref:bifunctional 4-hydroxy-2-oxoglutarate aldolase/2-dehydro-3-deoxy-phosphogluconate aldolase n=1 Tax=Streptomyces inhibens TaxID=2293571 RepID=UPI001EE69E2F|nr:bifunctional 4-hydroxy-2-oxoglutarate aldolase/2-dehydro-3-deoxy-phosphogluconate aldolase [Streptomyces inhibens]UKY54178.1 bifunctional 4-hydroxy-2-oxoglutarate aldolase/2-dehydro-3-deoxy-phosphogluconate aldolase [Streptomyces inhibens]